jgi:hypothetical protein
VTKEPLTVFLLYSLRFSVIFMVVILWVVAMSDIGSHVRKGLFTAAKLASIAVAVSVVAVAAIAALNALSPSQEWTGIDPKGSATVPPARQECEAFSYTFTYSFGLRRPTSVPRECMAGPTESFQPSHVPRQRTAATEG